MSAVMVAMDRDALLAEAKAWEYAERRIQDWAFERRRQQEQRAEFHAQLRRIRSTANTDGAAAAVFHGTRQLTKRERIMAAHHAEIARLLREKVRRAELAARRGAGPVRKCPECRRIYRGDADTCGCKPCAHCGDRFCGEGFKCESCKADPLLITARGTETRSFVPRLEAQPRIEPLSAGARRIDALLDELEPWMRYAVEQKYLHRVTERNAADDLRISVSTFAGRCKAAVARVAELLANDEHVPV